MRHRVLIAAAGLLAAFAAAAAAGPRITYVTGGDAVFSVEIPDAWMVNVGSETAPEAMPEGVPPLPRIFSAVPDADADMWTGFWSPPGVASLADARAWIETLDAGLLDDPKVESDESVEIDGAPGFILRGVGAREGRPLVFSLAVVQAGSNRVAVLVFIGEAEARKAWADDLTTILQSVRAAS